MSILIHARPRVKSNRPFTRSELERGILPSPFVGEFAGRKPYLAFDVASAPRTFADHTGLTGAGWARRAEVAAA